MDNMDNMDNLKVILQLAAVVVSVLGACTSVYFALRSQSHAISQRRLQKISLKRQHYGELRKWAEEAASAMTEIIFLCELDPEQLGDGEYFKKRHELRMRTSCIIDRGRWYLPNTTDNYGMHKPAAFQGIRQPALDHLVNAFKTLGHVNYREKKDNLQLREKFVEFKRDFIAEIQIILSPRELEKEIENA
jgi:hypothetical protein